MSGITKHLERYGFRVTNVRQSWGAVNARGDVFLICWQHEINNKERTLFLLAPEIDGTRYGGRERTQHIEAIRNGAKAWAVLCEEDKSDSDNPERERIKDFDQRRVWPLHDVFAAENGWIYCKVDNPVDVEALR